MGIHGKLQGAAYLNLGCCLVKAPWEVEVSNFLYVPQMRPWKVHITEPRRLLSLLCFGLHKTRVLSVSPMTTALGSRTPLGGLDGRHSLPRLSWGKVVSSILSYLVAYPRSRKSSYYHLSSRVRQPGAWSGDSSNNTINMVLLNICYDYWRRFIFQVTVFLFYFSIFQSMSAFTVFNVIIHLVQWRKYNNARPRNATWKGF